MKFAAAIAALLLCAAAQAQTMYKCKDAAGRVTYSGNECRQIGLGAAGEVRGTVPVVPTAPAARPASDKSAVAAKPAIAPGKPGAYSQAALATKDSELPMPEKRCFNVKSGKGNVVRCNYTPGGMPPK